MNKTFGRGKKKIRNCSVEDKKIEFAFTCFIQKEMGSYTCSFFLKIQLDKP